MHRAREYWNENRDDLVEAVRSQSELEPAFTTIELLRDRIQVTPRQYARARAKFRGKQAMDQVKELATGRIIYGLQELFSRAAAEVRTNPTHEPNLPDPIKDQFGDLLEPGDVMVMRKEHVLSNYFLPGYWPHVALYPGTTEELQNLGLMGDDTIKQRLETTDSNRPGWVLEALKDGVRLRSIESAFGCDALAVARPQHGTDSIVIAFERGMSHEGKHDDFDFNFKRSDRLVCTEVVYRTFEGIDGTKFGLTKRAGRWTLSAEDLLDMALRGESFKTVAAYTPDQKQVLSDTAVHNLLEETMGG